mgnify:CR=1 FL=1
MVGFYVAEEDLVMAFPVGLKRLEEAMGVRAGAREAAQELKKKEARIVRVLEEANAKLREADEAAREVVVRQHGAPPPPPEDADSLRLAARDGETMNGRRRN